MAIVPTEKEIKKIQKITRRAIRRKKIAQFFRGKSFDLPTGGSSGVIPEKDWRAMK